MVAGQDLGGAAAGVVIEDKVFKQVEEVFFPADAAQHGLQRDAAGLLLIEALPLVEELVLAAEGAHFGLHPVGEDQKGVVSEKVRDRVQIVRIVVGVGVLHVHRGVFELHEQQRQAVDKADDIRPPAIEVAVNLHFLHREEAVFRRVLKVDHHGAALLRAPVRAANGDGDAVAQEEVFLLVDLQERRGGEPLLQRPDGLADLGGCDPGVEFLQRSAEIPFQQDLFVACPSQRAVFPQHFLVVGIDHIPSQLVMQQIPRRLLDKDVFGIVIRHSVYLIWYELFTTVNMILKLQLVIRRSMA